jgi:hypothetical protein
MQHPLLNFFCHTHHPDIDVRGQAGVRPPLPNAGRLGVVRQSSERQELVA